MKVLRIERENATYQILEALKSNRQKRTKRGEIFVESVASINAAVQSGLTATWIACAGSRKLSGWARDTIDRLRPDSLLQLSDRLMERVSNRGNPSEIVAVMPRPSCSLSDIAPTGTNALYMILDRPSNAGNLGSIMRSADAFGVDGLITCGHGVDLYDPQVIRASLGAVFHLPLAHEPSSSVLIEWLESLKLEADNLSVIGTDSAGQFSLRETELLRPLVLLFGNEATGLSQALSRVVDRIVAIPITGTVNSLNLASAASIFLYSVKQSGDS